MFLFIKMGRGLSTILLLILSTSFMTFAWYGHLKFGTPKLLSNWGMFGVIVMSWLIAFFEYCAQVPANRLGFNQFGGPFSLLQLKIIQEVITLVIFVIFTTLFFKGEPLKVNHLLAFICLILAVYFVFK